ncbi:hypothetical protein M8J77_002839 [Diaphorina citri]|nr:hypothetical protein M8J77_002839 [Diaphorina citri]
MTIPNLKRLTTEDLKPAIFEVDDTVTAGMSTTSWKIHHLLKEEGRKFLFPSGRNPGIHPASGWKKLTFPKQHRRD